MKNLKLILSICLLAVTTTASAQFANGSKKSSSSTTTVNTANYGRVYVSYNPLNIKPDSDDAKDINLKGFTFGFTKGISITKSLPLFAEIGMRLNYAFDSEEESESGYYEGYPASVSVENKYSYMGLAIPVNLAYKWTPSSSPLSITPFVGITLKGNLIAKEKITMSATVGTESASADEEYDYFDKDEVGKDDQWKRFQAGWQIGVGVDYKALYLGVHYGGDFGEVCKKTKTSNWGISLGYSF